MPLSSAVRERCRVLFQPDEELRYLFPATSVSLGGASSGWPPSSSHQRHSRDRPVLQLVETPYAHFRLCPLSPRRPARPGGHLLRAVPTDP
jgi:hypothetical protein